MIWLWTRTWSLSGCSFPLKKIKENWFGDEAAENKASPSSQSPRQVRGCLLTIFRMFRSLFAESSHYSLLFACRLWQSPAAHAPHWRRSTCFPIHRGLENSRNDMTSYTIAKRRKQICSRKWCHVNDLKSSLGTAQLLFLDVGQRGHSVSSASVPEAIFFVFIYTWLI